MPEEFRAFNSGRSARNLRRNMINEAEWQRRLPRVPLFRIQQDSRPGLPRDALQFSTNSALTGSYRAWWGQLAKLVRQVESTPSGALSDAEWKALTKAVIIAWKQTGILETRLRASLSRLRASSGVQFPNQISRVDPQESPATSLEALSRARLHRRPPPPKRPDDGLGGRIGL